MVSGSMKINWKWPSKKENNYAPWYAIAWCLLLWSLLFMWRVFLVPLYFIVTLLAVAIIFLMYGFDEAVDLWNDMK